MQAREPRWTLEELTAQVAVALGLDGPRQASGRVREVPDGRTIRYYGTLGLVDPPMAFRGRTALYNERHLWQLVAIKRMQARGLTLAEVQQRLLGASDALLAELAEQPHKARGLQSPGFSESESEPDDEPFWKAEPVAPTAPAAAQGARTLVSVLLDLQTTLLVEGVGPLDEHDLAALRAAAAPLLKMLAQRRMHAKPMEEQV